MTQLVKVTALILDLSVNPFSLNMYEKYMGDALKALCLAYLAYGLDIPADPEELWGDNTEPGMDLIKAKLVRYSSNLYAQAFSNPDTVLADNMDYDLRQYLMFLHLFVKKSFGLNLLVFADNELTD